MRPRRIKRRAAIDSVVGLLLCAALISATGFGGAAGFAIAAVLMIVALLLSING